MVSSRLGRVSSHTPRLVLAGDSPCPLPSPCSHRSPTPTHLLSLFLCLPLAPGTKCVLQSVVCDQKTSREWRVFLPDPLFLRLGAPHSPTRSEQLVCKPAGPGVEARAFWGRGQLGRAVSSCPGLTTVTRVSPAHLARLALAASLVSPRLLTGLL